MCMITLLIMHLQFFIKTYWNHVQHLGESCVVWGNITLVYFRFPVASMKMTFFRDVALYGLVEVYWHFRDDGPDDGGSKHLWNFGELLPGYMTQHPRRQSSSKITLHFSSIIFLTCSSSCTWKWDTENFGWRTTKVEAVLCRQLYING
jgi:hypothetical protein